MESGRRFSSDPAWGVALIPRLYGYAAHTTYQHLAHPRCRELASLSILRTITTGAFRFHENCIQTDRASMAGLAVLLNPSSVL
jgi:hypothetical protein